MTKREKHKEDKMLTVWIPAEQHRALKVYAASTNQTITEVIRKLLRQIERKVQMAE